MDERVQLPYQPIRASDQILGWLTSSAWNFGGHNADVSPVKLLAKTGSDERQRETLLEEPFNFLLSFGVLERDSTWID